jgi:hypothetical protein
MVIAEFNVEDRMVNECGAVGEMRIDWGNQKYFEKPRPNVTFSTTNHTT